MLQHSWKAAQPAFNCDGNRGCFRRQGCGQAGRKAIHLDQGFAAPLDIFGRSPGEHARRASLGTKGIRYIPTGFVTSANWALRGIEAVTIPVDDLIEALKVGGLPCTKDELQTRFIGFIDKRLRGKDKCNIRLSLDQ